VRSGTVLSAEIGSAGSAFGVIDATLAIACCIEISGSASTGVTADGAESMTVFAESADANTTARSPPSMPARST
jgi:hypothetical protein